MKIAIRWKWRIKYIFIVWEETSIGEGNGYQKHRIFTIDKQHVRCPVSDFLVQVFPHSTSHRNSHFISYGMMRDNCPVDYADWPHSENFSPGPRNRYLKMNNNLPSTIQFKHIRGTTFFLRRTTIAEMHLCHLDAASCSSRPKMAVNKQTLREIFIELVFDVLSGWTVGNPQMDAQSTIWHLNRTEY